MFVLKESLFSPFGLASEYAYLSACNGFFQVNGELSQLLADMAENEVTAAMEEEERAIHEQTSKEQQEMMHKVKLWYHNVLSVHPQEFTLHITQKAKTNIFKEYVKYPKYIHVAVTHQPRNTKMSGASEGSAIPPPKMALIDESFIIIIECIIDHRLSRSGTVLKTSRDF